MRRMKTRNATKLSPPKISKDSLNHLRNWLQQQQAVANTDYEYDSEINEINDAAEDSEEEFECNLKELEKPLNQLLVRHPDNLVKKRYAKECEWDKCNFESTDDTCYNNHVHDHILRVNPDESSTYKCLWNLCKFVTESRQRLLCHLDFHAYHTRLKTFGLGLANTISIPLCRHDSKFRNEIPDDINIYFCHWDGCTENFVKFDEFCEHVSNHIFIEMGLEEDQDRSSRHLLKDKKVGCRWDDCGLENPNIYQLRRHLRKHTNEKKIGCSNCGTLFINKKLFVEHCMRQVVNQRSFQCPDCYKSYASELLLKEHRKSHVNKYQCQTCGLSCQKKSVLARHFRYRHMTEKPFACDECPYKGKTKSDLENHKNTHKDVDNLFSCEMCNYTSKTLPSFKKHCAKEHLRKPQTYQCHCCEKQYLRGSRLSQHLMKEHQFKLAPGHSRFIYKEDLDGFYRLQTKRVEDLKGNLAVRIEKPNSNMEISYTIDDIPISHDPSTPINLNVQKNITVRPVETPKFTLVDNFNEDSKDINDFAVVRNYKRILKQKEESQG